MIRTIDFSVVSNVMKVLLLVLEVVRETYKTLKEVGIIA